MTDYQVISTQPWTYQDVTGRVVEGFRVHIRIIAFQEVHYLDVPNLNPITVKAAADNLVKQRKDLSTM